MLVVSCQVSVVFAYTKINHKLVKDSLISNKVTALFILYDGQMTTINGHYQIIK